MYWTIGIGCYLSQKKMCYLIDFQSYTKHCALL